MRRCLAVVSMLAATVALSGCGLLGGSDDSERSGSGAPGKPEVNQVSVAVLDTLEVAPLHYAIDQGYFRDAGLEVKLVDGRSGGDNTIKMISGDTDIAFSSYSPFFEAQSKGAADIKLIADASATAKGNATIMAAPGSSVRRITDLDGKRVGVSALGTMAHLLTESVAQVNGVDTTTIQWVPIPFPQTAAALLSGQIDAAYLTEPFRQQAMFQGIGDIADTSSGPTDGMPLTGYGTRAEFAEKHPNTIAAFQRAMVQATVDLNFEDYSQRERMVKVMLPELPDNLVPLVGWPELTYALDATRIQRTADLMTKFKVIPKLNVESMIIRPELPAA